MSLEHISGKDLKIRLRSTRPGISDQAALGVPTTLIVNRQKTFNLPVSMKISFLPRSDESVAPADPRPLNSILRLGTVLLTLLLTEVGLLAANQTLTWVSPTNNAVLLLGQAYPLTATASSGLPVTFRVESGPAMIANGTVTATNVGTVLPACRSLT